MSEKRTPREWHDELKTPDAIGKLALFLAGCDPLGEDDEPVDRSAYDAMVGAARAHLGAVKEEARVRGIHPLRVRVVAHPALGLAAIFACPDAMAMADELFGADAPEGVTPGVAQFNAATRLWAAHSLWPRPGTEHYSVISEGYSGAWLLMSLLAKSGFGGATTLLKKRA